MRLYRGEFSAFQITLVLTQLFLRNFLSEITLGCNGARKSWRLNCENRNRRKTNDPFRNAPHHHMRNSGSTVSRDDNKVNIFAASIIDNFLIRLADP